MNRSSLLRDVTGFCVGGLSAAVAAALVFLTFFPLPEPKPTDHTREALTMVVLVMFFCGGFIGRRGFSADFVSDMWPSVVTSLAVVLFLCFLAGLAFDEIAPLVGFALVGIITSSVITLLLQRWFPPKIQDDHDA
ncbi:MAG TPA: hypothetical protein VFV23_08910 [Verrucomicrobiae bacterium]|nr:hypothetical protein [Verrucomicrobiae bacterium]